MLYSLEEMKKVLFFPKNGDIIFLYGDLAAGKTTLSKFLIQNMIGENTEVTSPTYTYYNKYGENIYHFDLYRLTNYDEFFAIWWEEILDNPNNICIIEWPEILEKHYKPTYRIHLNKCSDDTKRDIVIEKE